MTLLGTKKTKKNGIILPPFLSFPSELEITVWCSPKMDMEHLVTETLLRRFLRSWTLPSSKMGWYFYNRRQTRHSVLNLLWKSPIFTNLRAKRALYFNSIIFNTFYPNFSAFYLNFDAFYIHYSKEKIFSVEIEMEQFWIFSHTVLIPQLFMPQPSAINWVSSSA